MCIRSLSYNLGSNRHTAAINFSSLHETVHIMWLRFGYCHWRGAICSLSDMHHGYGVILVRNAPILNLFPFSLCLINILNTMMLNKN